MNLLGGAKNIWKFGVSVVAIFLVVIHLFVPSITVDTITLILLIIALLPWIIPYIRGFEIPGVVKITFPEMKAATDKVKSGEVNIVNVKTEELKLTEHPVTIVHGPLDPFETLRKVYAEDPNLALVGFRIEIEKRLIQLAEASDIPKERRSLNRLLSELVRKEIVSSTVASGLSDLIALGNRAAHGVTVDHDAGQWVLDVGPSILAELDGTTE